MKTQKTKHSKLKSLGYSITGGVLAIFGTGIVSAESYIQPDAFSFVNQTTRDISTGITNFIPLWLVLTFIGVLIGALWLFFKKMSGGMSFGRR